MRKKLHIKNKNKVNKKKDKGFTLVEVLAVVVIISIILGIGFTIYLNTIKNSKEKATTLAINNVMDAAETYTKEYNSIRWLNTYEESTNQNELKITRQYVCITVNELINSGYFNKDFYENEIYNTAKITNNSYVKITRDIDSKSDIKINVLPEVKEYNGCDKSDDDLQINNPKRYTDTIEAEYKDKNANASTAGKYMVQIKAENSQESYKQDITSPNGQTVAIKNLTNNTKHIVSFCVTLDNITKCSHKDIYTADFEDSTINVTNYNEWSNSKVVTIKFKDTNIFPKEARYYFYSDVNASIEEDDVYICSDNSLQNCTTKTTEITSENSGNWYLVKDLDNDKEIVLSVQENLNNEGGLVKTKVLDKKGNESNTIEKIVNKIDIIAPSCTNISKMSNTVSNGTAIDLNSASNYISGTWYSGYVKTSAKCTDTGGSGCYKKTVTTVGQTTDVTDKEQESRSVNKQGGVTITWKVYDKAGNSATCSSVKVNLDRTNPSCKVTGGSSTWINKNITVTGTCSDTGGSGCESNMVSVTKTSNINASISPGIVKDNAGNTTTCGTAPVKIDKSAPTCTVSGGNTTWTNSNVTVTGTCSDTGGSGCVGNASVTKTTNTNTNVSPGTIYDNAGNSTTCGSKTVKIDKTAPTCTVSGGSSSWTNSNVTVTGTCNDTGGSGCVGNASVTKTSNTNTGVSPGIVKDNAGNTTTCGTAPVKIDKSAPTCTVSGGSSTWTNSNVTVTGTCNDTGGSGCVGNASVTKTTNTNTNVSPGTIYDNAGNSTTCGSKTVKIDKTAPTCTVSGGSSSWTNSNVTVTGTCNDTGGSGCVGNASVTKTSNTNTGVSPGTVKDNAGNSTTCGTKTVKIDKSAPGIPTSTIRYASSTGTVRTNANTWTNQTLWWGNFSATDTGGSGINHYEYSTNCSGSKSGNLGTSYTYSSNYNYSYCIRAIDNAGNTGSWSSANYFKIDKTPPTCSVSGGSSSWTKNNVTVTGTCSDTGGSNCKSNSVSITKTTDTNTSVSPGTVEDNAGNKTTCGTKTVKIDKTAPTTPTYTAKYASSGSTYTSGTWTNSKVNTVISSTDSGSGISNMQYSSDKSSWSNLGFSVSALTKSGTTWTGTEPWTLKNRNDTYYFRACDSVGNCSGSSSKFNVKYDITAPTCTSSKSNTYTTSGVTATFSCSDNSSGVVSCTSNKTGLTSTKSYTIKDNAGNSGTCNVTVNAGTRYKYRTCSACSRCAAGGCKTWPDWSTYYLYKSRIATSAACTSAKPANTNTYKYICRAPITTYNYTSFYQIHRITCSQYSASCVNCGCSTWNSWTGYTSSSCSEVLKGKKETLKDCSSAYVYW